MNTGFLIFAMFLGFIATEGTIEYIFGTLFDKVAKLTPYKWALMYASLVVGVYLAFFYQLDMVYIVAQATGATAVSISWVGLGATGVIIGRGANFINDVWQRFFPNANARG